MTPQAADMPGEAEVRVVTLSGREVDRVDTKETYTTVSVLIHYAASTLGTCSSCVTLLDGETRLGRRAALVTDSRDVIVLTAVVAERVPGCTGKNLCECWAS